MENKTESVFVQNLIDAFEDNIEEKAELTPEDRTAISGNVTSQDKLEEGLPLLLQKSNDYKQQIENCDRNIKMWQESKKLWQGRSQQFLDLLGFLMDRLHIPGKTLKRDGVKLSTSSRSTIELDEDWLLKQYQALADSFQQQLPDYVRVKLAVDKNKLNAFLKTDNSMLVNNPEMIHTKVSTSTTIK